MRRKLLTRLCTAMPIAFTAERSLRIMPASCRFARRIFPLRFHQINLKTLEERGAVTRVTAASQLSGVATNDSENRRPKTCCARRPKDSSVPLPLTQLDKGSSSSGPSFTRGTMRLRRFHNTCWSDLRSTESRGFIVGNRFFPYDRTLKERLRRSQLNGQVPESNFRSQRGSLLIASISSGAEASK